MRGARLLQTASIAKDPSESSLSTRLLQLGGTALVVGGLGYLWYRNSSFKVYREMSDEDACELCFKVKNALFPEFYRTVRNSYTNTVIQLQRENQNHQFFNILDPLYKERFLNASLEALSQTINLKLHRTLKDFEYERLGVYFYCLKDTQQATRVQKKLASGIPLAENEQRYKNLRVVWDFCAGGLIILGFQALENVQDLTRSLDHKECLKLLFDYEMESIQKMFDVYTELVFNQRCLDINKRSEELEKILQESLRMEPLVTYAREKVVEEGQEPPIYHPLLLFFQKALTPQKVLSTM